MPMMATTYTRCGKFEIDPELVDMSGPEMRAIMAACVVTRAEYKFHTGCIEYIALSPQFALLGRGCTIPKYVWTLEIDGVLGQITARIDCGYISKEAIDFWLSPRHGPST